MPWIGACQRETGRRTVSAMTETPTGGTLLFAVSGFVLAHVFDELLLADNATNGYFRLESIDVR